MDDSTWPPSGAGLVTPSVLAHNARNTVEPGDVETLVVGSNVVVASLVAKCSSWCWGEILPSAIPLQSHKHLHSRVLQASQDAHLLTISCEDRR